MHGCVHMASVCTRYIVPYISHWWVMYVCFLNGHLYSMRTPRRFTGHLTERTSFPCTGACPTIDYNLPAGRLRRRVERARASERAAAGFGQQTCGSWLGGYLLSCSGAGRSLTYRPRRRLPELNARSLDSCLAPLFTSASRPIEHRRRPSVSVRTALTMTNHRTLFFLG